ALDALRVLQSKQYDEDFKKIAKDFVTLITLEDIKHLPLIEKADIDFITLIIINLNPHHQNQAPILTHFWEVGIQSANNDVNNAHKYNQLLTDITKQCQGSPPFDIKLAFAKVGEPRLFYVNTFLKNLWEFVTPEMFNGYPIDQFESFWPVLAMNVVDRNKWHDYVQGRGDVRDAICFEDMDNENDRQLNLQMIKNFLASFSDLPKNPTYRWGPPLLPTHFNLLVSYLNSIELKGYNTTRLCVFTNNIFKLFSIDSVDTVELAKLLHFYLKRTAYVGVVNDYLPNAWNSSLTKRFLEKKDDPDVKAMLIQLKEMGNRGFWGNKTQKTSAFHEFLAQIPTEDYSLMQ
ncbi:MAG: hypothetical protein P0S94_03225, partial [Simkaniaceae bacterium]|nr:hypothetical protein [Simkaniaceae bacterium]